MIVHHARTVGGSKVTAQDGFGVSGCRGVKDPLAIDAYGLWEQSPGDGF